MHNHPIVGASGEPLNKAAPPKVGIVILTQGYVSMAFSVALASLTYAMGLPLALFSVEKAEDGIEMCHNHEMDWIFFLDPRLTFPSDALLRLLKFAISQNKHVVGCDYPPGHCQNLEGKRATHDVSQISDLPRGFLLMRSKVLANHDNIIDYVLADEECYLDHGLSQHVGRITEGTQVLHIKEAADAA